MRLVEAAEVARRRRFDWLVRLRPDLEFHAPIGRLADLDARAVHASFRESGLGDVNDHFAIVPREHATAYFDIGSGCPSALDVQTSRCMGDLAQGQHTYPECAIKMRLEQFGAPIANFPRIFSLVRDDSCVRTVEMWRGLSHSDKCGNTGN
uniref:Uncharacterized protein n=1 Tax=Zooxanthella nutricula TaxID=1333877 RepID=A0A7S2HX08_9DINO